MVLIRLHLAKLITASLVFRLTKYLARVNCLTLSLNLIIKFLLLTIRKTDFLKIQNLFFSLNSLIQDLDLLQPKFIFFITISKFLRRRITKRVSGELSLNILLFIV